MNNNPPNPTPSVTEEMIEARVAELAALEENWDSYRANPIAPEVLARAKRAALHLSKVDLYAYMVPHSDGGVSVNLTSGEENTIEFCPNGTATLYREQLTDGFALYLAMRAADQPPPNTDLTDVERQDWWKPDPEDPFWMLEAEDGEWLKNEHSKLGTRNPVKAKRYPTEEHALSARRRLYSPGKWWSAKPTEHTWIAAMQQPVHADEVERLRTLLEPFARVAERFGAIEGGVVEICRPHPNNPSPNIMPFGVEHFNRARAALLVSNRSGVEAAYREGHQTGRRGGSLLEEDDDWEKSKARAALDTENSEDHMSREG